MRGDFIKRLLWIFLLLAVILPKTYTKAATLESQAALVATASGSLNIRSGPSAASSRVGTLPKGSYVTVLQKQGQWYQVEYGKGQFGYCSASYLSPQSAKALTVATSSGSLNVRTGPGTTYGKAAALPKGEVVIRLSEANGWSRILYHGTKTGYVSSGYLSAGASPVSLWVQNFKQNDPRWANVTIGTSGKPMSQIGCATTAIAMVESHRRGYAITPDVMARQLRYTPGGSVYWPEHYTVVTSYSLSKIESLLRQGKPILLGATNTYGSQHWVVITGYNGQGLTPGNFTIHDPGTQYRTNLQQFLDAYPNFYKYFYY